MSLSIVIPTLGRPSLARTLNSLVGQLRPDDQVLVCSAGELPGVRELVRHYHVSEEGWWEYIAMEGQHGGNWGHGLTNHAFDCYAAGDYWARMDDDDIYLPGALAAMREAANGRPVVFRARWGAGHPANGVVLWRERRVRIGSIATPMVVAPRSRARYGLQYTGDFDYAVQLEDLFGEFSWREDVICEVRPG